MAAFLWVQLKPDIDSDRPWLNWLRLAGLTLMLIVSIYAAVWIAFYAVPILVEILRWFAVCKFAWFWREFIRDQFITKTECHKASIYLSRMILVFYTAAYSPHYRCAMAGVKAWLIIARPCKTKRLDPPGDVHRAGFITIALYFIAILNLSK
jgi:hypothetical protein